MILLGQGREKEALNHRNVVYSGHAQHEPRREQKGLQIGLAPLGWNWIGSSADQPWVEVIFYFGTARSVGNGRVRSQLQDFGSRPASTSVLNCKWTGKNTLSKSQWREQRITAPRKSRIEEWTHHQDAEFSDRGLWEESVDSSCPACEESLAFLTAWGSESTVHESHVTSRDCWHLATALGGRDGRKESWGPPGKGKAMPG